MPPTKKTLPTETPASPFSEEMFTDENIEETPEGTVESLSEEIVENPDEFKFNGGETLAKLGNALIVAAQEYDKIKEERDSERTLRDAEKRVHAEEMRLIKEEIKRTLAE